MKITASDRLDNEGAVGARRVDWRQPAALAVVVVMAALIAYRDRRVVLIDDAAITFRYAERIAGGQGFTYNDGDRTNGASAPGYTLLLALSRSFGFAPVATATALAVATYAASVGLVTWISHRLAGVLAGALTAWLLVGSWTYRVQMMSGMESGVAVVVGLVAVVALLRDRPVWCGVFVGLAVFNKLDAGLLAVAVFVSWLIVHRRIPWKIVVAATAVMVPWVLFATVYFGSVVPYSATQKLGTVGNPTTEFDPRWIIGGLVHGRELLLIGLVVAAAPMLVAQVFRPNGRSAGLLVVGLWSLSHLAFFSLVDLGDRYPWYMTVIVPGFAILGGTAVHWWWGQISQQLGTAPVVLVSCSVVAGVLLLNYSRPQVIQLGRLAKQGHHVDAFESFELTRRDAGRWLGENARPGEVVETCFGWIAFGALDSPIRETCPLSTRKAVGPTRWVVEAWFREFIEPDESGDRTLVAEFRSPATPPGASFVLQVDDPGERPADEATISDEEQDDS